MSQSLSPLKEMALTPPTSSTIGASNSGLKLPPASPEFCHEVKVPRSTERESIKNWRPSAIIKLTGITAGDPAALPALTVIFPLYEPLANSEVEKVRTCL